MIVRTSDRGEGRAQANRCHCGVSRKFVLSFRAWQVFRAVWRPSPALCIYSDTLFCSHHVLHTVNDLVRASFFFVHRLSHYLLW